MTQAIPTKSRYRWLTYPAIGLLFIWMIVPLSMTIYFSFINYNLLYPERGGFVGFDNYAYFFTDPALPVSILNTIVLTGSVLVLSLGLGIPIAILLNKAFWGRGIVRVLLISPFFVMPTVNALIWKNMFFHPVYGILAFIAGAFGFDAIDWFANAPMMAIVIILSWQWLPFAVLILMTALQSLDEEQVEAAMLDGAKTWMLIRKIILPHLSRAITVILMIESIFLLAIFAEIYITTGGGPGLQTTNLTFLIFTQALSQFDVGIASAGGLIAVILANVIAIFLIRVAGKNFGEDN